MSAHQNQVSSEPSQAINRLLSVFLREPCRRIKPIQARHERLQRHLECRRNQSQTPSQLQRYLRRFRFPQQQSYQELLASDPRSRILVSFHFCDYIYGLHFLVNQVQHPGRVKVLSQRAGSALYWQNMRSAFGSRAVTSSVELLVKSHHVLSLSEFLRSSHNTLIMFCDLPAGCGEQTRVRFLQRDAWFPKGPATLAVLNRVPLLPVINVMRGREQHIVLYPQMEAAPMHEENYPDCISRLTQNLVTILEQHLLSSPESWRYLQRLPFYFAEAKSAQMSLGMETT